MEDFKDLRVWQKAYELTLSVYRKSASFPKEEIYGLTSQLRRATMSIGANTLPRDAVAGQIQK
jgi:23S rRNA-intervening sequence protein